MYCKSYAKSQPWASVWQSRGGSSAILSAEISAAIGNPKVKRCLCVFVCFLFFYGYKTENRWVQKTKLALTAAKLYIPNLLWVTRQRAAACPSSGTDSPKFCSLEKSDLQVQSKKVFQFPIRSGWLLMLQVSFLPLAVLQTGLGLSVSPSEFPHLVQISPPCKTHLFRSKDQLSTSRQAWNLRRAESAITHIKVIWETFLVTFCSATQHGISHITAVHTNACLMRIP